MAQVSFTIRAVDATRAAFASINQRLRGLVTGGDVAQKRMLGLGLRLAGIGSIAAVVGGSIRKVAQDIENIPGVDQDAIDSWGRLREAAKTTQGVIQNVVASAGTGLVSLGRLIRFGAIAAMDGLDAAQRDVIESDRLAAEQRRANSGAIDKEIESMRKLGEARKALRLVNESAGASVTRRREEAEQLEAQAGSVQDLAKRNEILTQAVRLRFDAERDMRKIVEENAKAQTAAANAISRSNAQTVPLTQRIEGLRNAYWATNVELAKYNDLNNPQHLEERTRIFTRQVEIQDQLTRAYEEQNKLAREVGSTIASGFEDAIFSGEKLSTVLQNLALDIMRLVFRNLITVPLANMLTGGILSAFGGGRAVGGPVSAGTSYMVGENGPELFTPSTAGRIIPNHAIGGAGGGGGMSFNFVYNIANGVSRTELLPLLKMTQRETIARISESQRRGMPLAAAMA